MFHVYVKLMGELDRVTREGMYLHGRYAPPGKEVACNTWFVHYDEKIYSADDYGFRPER
jgi:cytochrome P450